MSAIPASTEIGRSQPTVIGRTVRAVPAGRGWRTRFD